MRNNSEFKKIMIRKAHYKFSIMMTTMQTTNHMLRLSLNSWSMFLTNSEKWMCGFISESSLPYSFSQLTSIGEEIFRHSLTGVQ